MARIAIFASRKHHAEKLGAIYNGLEQNGHEVFWITCNNSLNIDSPLEFLVPNQMKFVHVYDQVLTDREKKQIDVEAKKIINKSISVSPHFSPFWIVNSANEMGELFVLFEKFLKESQTNAVIVLHNANFFSRILSFIANKLKIPVFGFQEGMLRQRDQDSFEKQSLIANYTTKTFCWSRNDLEQIKKADPAANLTVGGLYHLDYTFDKLKTQKEIKQNKILSFVPTMRSEYTGNIEQDALWLKSLCDKNRITFIFKPHPFEEKAFGIPAFDGDITEVLLHSDYIVSQHSTVMIESAVLGKHTAEINRTNFDATESLAGEAYFRVKTEQDFNEFVSNGFISKKWVNSMGYKVGNRTAEIVGEIEKWL